jgi:phospholipase A1
MNERAKSFGHWFRFLLVAGVFSGGIVPVSAGELSLTLLGPAAPVTAGAEIKLWLHVMNVSAWATAWKFPGELTARLRSGGLEIQVRLQLADAARPNPIAPQCFARAEYTLRLPTDFTGDAVLEADDVRGSAVVLRIQPATVSPATATQTGSVSSSFVESERPNWRTQEFNPIDYFKRHLFPHEPFYFVVGPDSPNAKFQFSFKYQLVDDRSGLANQVRFVTNLFFGFTQTSLWDWNKASAPFEDSSYKPELMFQFNRLAQAGEDDWFRLDLQTGAMHESNGRDGAASRSLNIAYLRPKLIFGHDDGWQFTLASRVWVYVGDLLDNPDLARYRGHADFRATFSAPSGLQLAALTRVGDDFDRGSLQLDLTFPLRQIRWAGFTWYLQAQYFTGYGESLLHYNERSAAYRFGFSLYR